LLEEYERTGAISLRGFYIRRALRLLPALLALVIVFGAVTIATSDAAALSAILLRLAAVVFYAANWAIVAGFGLYPFAHTWSLAIEEQFYVLWPLGVLVLLRYIRRRSTIVSIVAAGIGVSIAWRSILVHHYGALSWAYQGVDARSDSLLIGCAVGMLTSWRMMPCAVATPARLRWVSLIGAIGLCLLFATARFPSAFQDHFASTLTALAGGLLIMGLLVPGSRLARWLENRGLVAVGKISYGLYLWHFPIFLGLGVLVGRMRDASALWLGLAWMITFAVCIASFKLLEQPALRLKARYGQG
jgi:peptidoglycan/LPS O-acetylase OafA/YrhL